MEKLTSLVQYQQLASRTCIDLGSEKKNDQHMASGVYTELGEGLTLFKAALAYNRPIDFVNLSEENSDAMWFLVNQALQEDFPIEENLVSDMMLKFTEENQRVARLPLEEKIEITIDMYFNYINAYLNNQSDINELIYFFMQVSEIWNLDFFQGLTNNIEKLQKRFPEKFTEDAANNRDLEAERSVLGKGIDNAEA